MSILAPLSSIAIYQMTNGSISQPEKPPKAYDK